MPESTADVRIMLERIAKSLVDAPEEVFVELFDDGVIELEVAESDVGKLIGRQGRTARALRALLSAAGHRTHKRYSLEITEQWWWKSGSLRDASCAQQGRGFSP